MSLGDSCLTSQGSFHRRKSDVAVQEVYLCISLTTCGQMLQVVKELHLIVRLSPTYVRQAGTRKLIIRQCVTLTRDEEQLCRIPVLLNESNDELPDVTDIVTSYNSTTSAPVYFLTSPSTKRIIAINAILRILYRQRIDITWHRTEKLRIVILFIVAHVAKQRKQWVPKTIRHCRGTRTGLHDARKKRKRMQNRKKMLVIITSEKYVLFRTVKLRDTKRIESKTSVYSSNLEVVLSSPASQAPYYSSHNESSNNTGKTACCL